MDRFVWVDDRTDQRWMSGGTYLIARRIRIHLEAWDRSTLGEQERTIGRIKATGAPLGGQREYDPVDLGTLAADGTFVVPYDAHIRVASPDTNHGAAILRRGYSFADGVDPISGELDAGLFFICFQKDPANQIRPGPAAIGTPGRPHPVRAPHRQRHLRLPAGRRPGGALGPRATLTAEGAVTEIDTERLHLRPLAMSDSDALFALHRNPDMQRYFGDGRLYTRDESRGWLEWHVGLWREVGYSFFAVELRTSGRFIGWVGLNQVMDQPDLSGQTEIGWFIDSELWGQGLATEARPRR